MDDSLFNAVSVAMNMEENERDFIIDWFSFEDPDDDGGEDEEDYFEDSNIIGSSNEMITKHPKLSGTEKARLVSDDCDFH
jgi:hypothetical protein